ncbi:MAG: YncE family protein, partial [Muribaculaceae bacterium]|nr:YncE family protein [Muribaculaceae bacterium]
VLDRYNKLWVLNDGGYPGNPVGYEAPTLCRIDAETFVIERVFRFRLGDTPAKLQLNGSKDMLYWINDDVWQMDVTSERLPVRPLLDSRGTKYYGLTVNPVNSEVYVADAIDYQQQGIIYRYTPQGSLISEFYVGVSPAGFCWK